MSRVLDLSPPPIGVRVLESPHEAAGVRAYDGISYCDAVRRAGSGMALRVLPGSIRVCRWAPVVLRLKPPENDFEARLAPRLHPPAAGLLLAPACSFPGDPQVVLVRATRERLHALITRAGATAADGAQPLLWSRHRGRLDLSAVSLFQGREPGMRTRTIHIVNETLAFLARSARWRALTLRLFRSHAVTVGFDAIISRTLADMSMCRNSTVIPLRSGQVNVSFFCTGGITWGRNDPDQLTSGWPWPIFRRLLDDEAAPQ